MRKERLSSLYQRRANVDHRRFSCLCLMASLLWTLSGCGSGATAPEFPPTEETVRTAAEELGWTLDGEETQSWAEDQILYTLEAEDQTTVFVSCALVEGDRYLTENCAAMSLPDKPQFAWPSRRSRHPRSRRRDPIRQLARSPSAGKWSARRGMDEFGGRSAPALW